RRHHLPRIAHHRVAQPLPPCIAPLQNLSFLQRLVALHYSSSKSSLPARILLACDRSRCTTPLQNLRFPQRFSSGWQRTVCFAIDRAVGRPILANTTDFL